MTILIAGLSIIIAIAALLVALMAMNRSADLARQLTTTRRDLRKMDRDLEKVERALQHNSEEHGLAASKSESPVIQLTDSSPALPPPTAIRIPARRPRPQTSTPIDWEKFVGRRLLGWVAVGLVLLAATFFIKYAFETVFGPTARVATGAMVGLALCLVGGRFGVRGKTLVCSMVCSAGLLILYLSVYAAFGYYALLQPMVGGAFLAAIVAEGVLLSVCYRARPLAYLALSGSLIVPALIPADQDRYESLFLYLAVVNIAAALLTRSFIYPGLRLLTYLGSQILFWVWFYYYYHPEKMAAVLGVQGGLYLVWMLAGRFTRVHLSKWERVAMWLATALCFFLTLHRIVDEEAAEWRGVLAIVFAVWYAVLARVAMPAAKDMTRTATLLALAFGFLGMSIPLQSGAPWTAVGWAAIGAALWWFGLRVREPLLCTGGIVFIFGSLIALASAWSEIQVDNVDVPFFNRRSLPMIGVASCLLAVSGSSRRFRDLQTGLNIAVQYTAGLGAVSLIWIVLTWETLHTGRDIFDLSEMGAQTVLSIVWALYAAVLLTVGFAWANPLVRWIGLGLLAVTLMKLITYDLSELPAIYRALTFLAVAVVTAAAAWGYQRVAYSERADHD
jgi:uncharacterized membrane protein